MNKPKILAFSRVWYSQFYPHLESDKYELYHAVVSKKEKEEVLNRGGNVVACFKEEYDDLDIANFSDLLLSSYSADRSNNVLSLADRNIFIGKAVSFWQNIFNESKYDFILHETIAIEHDEILSLVAKKYSILDLNYITSVFHNTFYWKKSPYNTSFPVNFLEKIKASPNSIERATEYFDETVNKGYKPEYVHSTKWKKVHKTNILRLMYLFTKYVFKDIFGFNKKYSYKEIKDDAIFNYRHGIKRQSFYEWWMDLLSIRINEYDDFESIINLKNIVFPLHYEPEATLSYFGNEVTHQDKVLQEICDYLPKGYNLIVKEHPQQVGMLLTRRFYDIKKRNSNLSFLSADLDSFEIIQNSKAVVTFVSSVGWEAAISGTPTFCLGNVFYDKHPNVIKLNALKKVEEIDYLIKKFKPINKESSINYIAKIYELSLSGTPNHKTKINDQSNIIAFKSAIEDQVKNYLEDPLNYWLNEK